MIAETAMPTPTPEKCSEAKPGATSRSDTLQHHGRGENEHEGAGEPADETQQ